MTDRNPQVFMNIAEAKPEDFKAATQHVYRAGEEASGIVLPVLTTPYKEPAHDSGIKY